MRLFALLAFRNLWRQPSRTGLTIAAMACGTGLLIVSLGLMYGMLWDMVAGATENYHGHAVITADRYLERRRIQLTLPEDRPPQRVLSAPEVLAHSARVHGFALLSAGDGKTSRTQPAELLGIDPAGERGVSRLPKRVAEGRFLLGLSGKEMVLGKGLTQRIGAEIGSKIAVMGQAADGSIAAELFTMVGILDSGDQIRDASLALVGRRDLQELLVLEGRVHEWVLALNAPLAANSWAAGKHIAGAEVSSWHRFLPQMAEMLELIGVYRAIYAFVFYFAVLLVTMNTMYMALLEREREFAVMGAAGLQPVRLASLLMLEALMLSIVAAGLGGALGAAGSFYLEAHPLDFRGSFSTLSWVGASIEPVFRASPTWDGIFWPMGMTVLLGFFVALLPAWKLYRMRPVDILREV
ncbi:MAG: FtsX-like permease family protein [Elusimicrobiota bacterium]